MGLSGAHAGLEEVKAKDRYLEAAVRAGRELKR